MLDGVFPHTQLQTHGKNPVERGLGMDFKTQLKRYRAIEEIYADVRLLTKKCTAGISYTLIQEISLLYFSETHIR